MGIYYGLVSNCTVVFVKDLPKSCLKWIIAFVLCALFRQDSVHFVLDVFILIIYLLILIFNNTMRNDIVLCDFHELNFSESRYLYQCIKFILITHRFDVDQEYI